MIGFSLMLKRLLAGNHLPDFDILTENPLQK